MSTVAVYSYAHSVSYVTDNILKSFKDVIVQSGLDPQKLAGDHKVLHAGIKRWIETEHLEFVTLEIYHPKTDALIGRWDIAVSYAWSSDAGNFWVDSDAIRYAVKKLGVQPAEALYRSTTASSSTSTSSCDFVPVGRPAAAPRDVPT